MSLIDILYILALTGPLFQISNLIGIKRTRAIEIWLLERFYLLIKVSILLVKLILFLVVIIFLTFIFVIPSILEQLFGIVPVIIYFIADLLIIIYLQLYLGYQKLKKYTTILGIFTIIISASLFAIEANFIEESYSEYVTLGFSIMLLLPFILLQLIAFYTYFYAQTKIAHKYLNYYCQSWRNKVGTKPPWPISVMEGSFKAPETYWILNGTPFLFLFYGVLIPIILIIALLLLIPFWGAEKLRKRLIPEKPIFMDLFGYLISTVSIVILVFDRFVN